MNSFADERLIGGCIYCTRETGTRDHVPSRILLDEPYPENLPVVAACPSCNGGFSLDEQYFACLVESARSGSVDAVKRPKIRRILSETPALAARIMQARSVAADGKITFMPEAERVRRVILKLAMGHAAYELDEQKRGEPSHILFTPLSSLSPEALEHFEIVPQQAIWPEVGTRAMQRMAEAWQVRQPGWVEVQEGQYRYFAVADGDVLVRLVIGEYLAGEVMWEEV